MSTTILPDIYRHIARKTTVSRNIKPPCKNISLCNSSFNNCKEERLSFETIQCDIKLESDISLQEQSFVIIPDNEIEQMSVEQTNEEIIYDILEQIKNQIDEDLLNQTENSFRNQISISTDIHNVVDSLMNRFDENNHEQSINTTNTESTANDVLMEDVTRSLNEEVSIESEQQSSMHSRSQIEDDIVEIEASTSNIHQPSCVCQCHQTTSNSQLTNSTSEYLLFEQALQQTRQDQQQERSLNNNRLIQTLKRQHQDLISLYERQLHINKIDREQQTMVINHHDSQIQTDITTIQQQQTFKPNVYQVNGTHSTPNPKGPQTTTQRPFNSFLTPIRTTGPSLQQLIPCLTTTTTATTATLTNKTATTVIKKTTTTNSHSPLLPPLSSSTSVSHDIVDLTEEDDDDSHNRAPIPIRSQQSLTSTLSSTAHIQSANRSEHSNSTTPLGQTFPLRPLSEHISCDHSIARPQLNITQDNTIVRLTWNLPSTPMESILNYEIYAYKQTAAVTTSDWKKIGTVKSMRLPMAVTLKEFQPNSHYAFAVRGVSSTNNTGPFCEPKTIFTGNTPIQPLNNGQILNAST